MTIGQHQSRALAGIDVERQGDVLVLGVAVELGVDFGDVKAIALEQIAHALGGGLNVGVIEGSAELEARGVLELAFAGRHFDFAVDLDRSDEPLLGRAEDERDTVAVRDGFDLDVGVVAGAVEAFDGFADFGDVEGRSGGERDEAGEIGAENGLRGRFVPDRGDRPAFELGGRREVRSRSDDCEKTRRPNKRSSAVDISEGSRARRVPSCDCWTDGCSGAHER